VPSQPQCKLIHPEVSVGRASTEVNSKNKDSPSKQLTDKDFWDILDHLDEPVTSSAHEELDIFEGQEESASPRVLLRSPIFRVEKDMFKLDYALVREVIKEPKKVA